MAAQVENAFWRKKVEGAGRTVKMMPMSEPVMKSRALWEMRIRNNKFLSQRPCSEETEHHRRNGQCYFWRHALYCICKSKSNTEKTRHSEIPR